MDSTTEELQQNELTALKSIYAEDFIETPPKAWKGANRLPEFIIRVPHPNPDLAHKICFNLHVMCVVEQSCAFSAELSGFSFVVFQISKDLSYQDEPYVYNSKTYQWTQQ